MAIDFESFQLLKQEIEQIGRDMRSGSPIAPEAKAAIGKRISTALDRFESLIKSEAYEVMAKDAPDPNEPDEVSEPEMPAQVLVKRGGTPGACGDCGQDPCACFSHLPRPKLTIRPDRMVKVEFGPEFTTTDKVAWLHAMKFAITKRKGK